ncbi:MAG: cobaltochelatase subunit CobN [Devosia sp. 67-54]|uniref:cobaltochelatase subunit CobN n=1 Tax=unclassified Devosia TaxID=196773 RepID=UPI00096119CE|nr:MULTISPECIES: cobaltochelatase subunit CobN [unclassified Devosia]MBN9304560.1 cobaltochelatase subunit CobN [Devosia sp.]OJX15444.1 MAG: cobaltochelatase subunit CobN [Devosia sp. 67-54]
MHLLSAQAGALQQDGEAIDLGQSPAPLVFASAADSELALLAGAADRAATDELRCANLLRLSHNLSVDLWIEKTVSHAKMVVVRLLGGPAYWPYGVDQLTALAAAGQFKLALLPGDATPDPILQSRSTVAPELWTRLHALFTAGGPENADAMLRLMREMAAGTELVAPTPGPSPQGGGEPAGADGEIRPFPRFGYWTPETGVTFELSASERPAVPLLFYRAALEGAGTATLEALYHEIARQGLAPLPLMISTLKEAACVRFVKAAFAAHQPQAILNLTGFALGLDGIEDKLNPFAETDAPVIQLVQGGRPQVQWAADSQGLSAKDLAMQIVLPELDGRIGGLIVGHKAEAVWHARTQCPLSSYAPDADGVRRAVSLAANWVKLRATPRGERRVAMVLANYPIRDGRLANGVGYDAPASTVEILRALETAGYALAGVPADGNALIERLQQGPTNAHPERKGGMPFSLTRYRELFAGLPETVQRAVTARWGEAEADPFVRGAAFHLPAVRFGHVAVLLQPARGYDRDDAAAYHDPDLAPPHAYVASYLWLKHEFGAEALIHNGKHGSLEWLPGKATALDATSYPGLLWGELPHLYPFIVNDPGEGTQAKRRTGAVIIDHLVPPLTRAETYGPLKDLEALLDEYYAASGMDRRRLSHLRRRILDFTRDARLDRDIGLPDDESEALKAIDTFLCDLKEAQIRDGLHVFGQSPAGRLERDLLAALARVPRGERAPDQSLIRALADDLKLGVDPLTAGLGDEWTGPDFGPVDVAPTPSPSPQGGGGRLRSIGDVVERLEELAAAMIEGAAPAPGPASAAVLAAVETVMRPRLRASGPAEVAALLDGLDGKFVRPGPSGAPSRGRLDVLPTGRNFYSVDNRAIPTPTAWELGRKSAEAVLARHFQDHGVALRSLALSVWGTSNMRTGGDDIAQALAFIGAKPVWDPSSLRPSGYEIVPLARLGRPRVDVTLRISGLFRDAFPQQIGLFDKAIRAIGALDEPAGDNPIAARMRSDALELMREGRSEAEAALAAGHRVFGSKPGAYGAGLQALIDSGMWESKADLGRAFLNWGQYAYGAHAAGTPELARFAARLGDIEAVVHNQDNREHDLLDSDDYYQFEGGLVATAESLTGRRPLAYHNDHSRPERPVARTLEEEISRVMRGRVVNPKWIAGVKRHGYKGAFEIIATVDYMFAFAATTGAVKTHHFDLAFEAFVEDEAIRAFLIANNRFGYDELIDKFNEARRRGYWVPRSNSAFQYLTAPHPAATRND